MVGSELICISSLRQHHRYKAYCDKKGVRKKTTTHTPGTDKTCISLSTSSPKTRRWWSRGEWLVNVKIKQVESPHLVVRKHDAGSTNLRPLYSRGHSSDSRYVVSLSYQGANLIFEQRRASGKLSHWQIISRKSMSHSQSGIFSDGVKVQLRPIFYSSLTTSAIAAHLGCGEVLNIINT